MIKKLAINNKKKAKCLTNKTLQMIACTNYRLYKVLKEHKVAKEDN